MCVPQFFVCLTKCQRNSDTHTYRAKHTVYIWHGCCNLSSASDPQTWLSAIACWPTNQSTAQSRPQSQLQTSSTTSFAIYNNYSLYPSRPRPLSNALFGPRNIDIERESERQASVPWAKTLNRFEACFQLLHKSFYFTEPVYSLEHKDSKKPSTGPVPVPESSELIM